MPEGTAQPLSEEVTALLRARDEANAGLLARLQLEWPLDSLVVAEAHHKGRPLDIQGRVVGHETDLDKAVIVIENVRSGAPRRIDVRWTKIQGV